MSEGVGVPDEVIDAERSVLGAMLLSPAVIDEVSDIVGGPDFCRPAHETIFTAVLSLFRARQPVDVITVGDALGPELGKIGGSPYLHKLVQFVPTAINGPYYAGIVADAGARRRLSTAGARIQQMAGSADDVAAMVEDARRAVDQVTVRSGDRVEFLKDTVDSALDGLGTEPKQVSTPWESVNSIIGGLRPGGLYVVGARPSVGKSVIGLQLAKVLTRQGSVAFASLEMSRDDIWARLISSDLRISMERVVDRSLSASDWEAIAQARQMWSEAPLAILDKSALTVTDIRRFARSTHRRQPLAGVVVDYMQLMAQPRGDKRPRHEFVADVSRQLKILAMDMSIPVIALSQLNRASEARTDKMPQLSDLRESGAVEQDADVVFLLHREIMGEARSALHLLVAKNRHGRTDTTELVFWGHYSMALDQGVNPRSDKSYELNRMGRTA